MLVRDHIVAVQDTLQDNKPPFARWPEKQVVNWTNFGQMALAKYLPLVSQRTDTIRMQPGTLQDFRRVLAANIKTGVQTDGIGLIRMVRNMGLDGTLPGRAIHGPVDRFTKDALEADWHNETGLSVREVVFDKGQPLQAWISPGAPADLPVWVQIEWMRYPVALAAGGDPGSEKYTAAGTLAAVALDISDQYAEELHHYTVAMLLLKGSKDFQNVPKAQYHAGLFMQSVNAQAQVAGMANPNLKAMPFMNEATA